MTETEMLSDEQLKEIEARKGEWTYAEPYNQQTVRLTVAERDALCQTVRALRERHTRLAEVSGEWATLLDRIRLWSKCEDGYPLNEHINNITTQNTALREQLAHQRAALKQIRDYATERFICECEHDNEMCCAVVNEYCPMCIAATALKEQP